ncbi:helix-turn-helix domain-containing protein [Paenactinomyces guangxiensis]|uniref:Helix-turn-helix domain-containing protein n=1 Tax=Paenactinomyces guangxiensis TaxID=1490290 RepID=A0A7W1WNY6_9BACL|nr:helix-turn-helix domain-containing protein [Paenactinomyces guangxiensis]MBA4493258.1 helix-turn-helix domain-containing protein [Paenactinomyces guangxiensis]MBH8589891.1 helix-turn-helix domain-containing protein [Paenactinomyces guangxiensis]
MGNPIDLSQFDMNLVSYIIRKRRNERGLTQEELSDSFVSDSTISNIENQEGNVKKRNIYHVLEKLGILRKQLPEVIKEVQSEINEIQFQLEFIETLIDEGHLEEGTRELESLSIEEYHPLHPYFLFLKARHFFRKKEWKKAKEHFNNAIKIFDQYKIKPTDNIISMCYNELSRCSSNQNNFEQALMYVNRGLNTYEESLARNDI